MEVSAGCLATLWTIRRSVFILHEISNILGQEYPSVIRSDR